DRAAERDRRYRREIVHPLKIRAAEKAGRHAVGDDHEKKNESTKHARNVSAFAPAINPKNPRQSAIIRVIRGPPAENRWPSSESGQPDADNSVQSAESSVQSTESSVQFAESSVQSAADAVQYDANSVQYAENSVQTAENSVQTAENS